MGRAGRCPPDEGVLRDLSAWEVITLRRRSLRRAAGPGEAALWANALLVARALERGGRPVYPTGRAVLKAMTVEEITRLADRWGGLYGPRGDGDGGIDPAFDMEEFQRRLEEERQ